VKIAVSVIAALTVISAAKPSNKNDISRKAKYIITATPHAAILRHAIGKVRKIYLYATPKTSPTTAYATISATATEGAKMKYAAPAHSPLKVPPTLPTTIAADTITNPDKSTSP
jgi:hypothetical protein